MLSKFFTGKPTGKRPRRRWEDNIGMDLKAIESGFTRIKVGIIWRAFVNAALKTPRLHKPWIYLIHQK